MTREEIVNKLQLDLKRADFFEAARQKAFGLRAKHLEQLEKLLLDFESAFLKNKGKIVWINRAEDGRRELAHQCGKEKRVISHQHPLLYELGILQNPPSQWKFFDEAYYTYNETQRLFPGTIQEREQKNLNRPWMLNDSDTTVLFPDWMVAETGSLVFNFKDPFATRALMQAKKLVLVVGIEQICKQLSEAEFFIQLNQMVANIGNGNSEILCLNGTKSWWDQNAPDEVVLLIVDNGRSDLLAAIPQRQALYCTQCGACQTVDDRWLKRQPLQNEIGGSIQLIQTPFINGRNDDFELSFLQPLSSLADQLCPINLNLKQLMLENRNEWHQRKLYSKGEQYGWYMWRTAMMSRKWLNQGNTIKGLTLKSLFRKEWDKKRAWPKLADQSFNQWWVQHRPPEEDPNRII